MKQTRIDKVERAIKQRYYAGVVVVHNYKEGDQLPDNVGPDTIVINLIDNIRQRLIDIGDDEE